MDCQHFFIIIIFYSHHLLFPPWFCIRIIIIRYIRRTKNENILEYKISYKIGTDPNLAAAYVSAGLPQFATSALSTTSAIGNMTLPSATGTITSISKQIEGELNEYHIVHFIYTTHTQRIIIYKIKNFLNTDDCNYNNCNHHIFNGIMLIAEQAFKYFFFLLECECV